MSNHTDVDFSFSDILDNKDIGLTVAGEAMWRRIGLVVDLRIVGLSADEGTPGPLFDRAEIESTQVFATAAGFYHVVPDAPATVDLFGGARLWYVGTELQFGTGLLPGVEFEDSETWVDPIVGVRANALLGSGFSFSGYADIGGFGAASDLTRQLLGTLDDRIRDWFPARIGSRHLVVDYEDDGFVWDVAVSSPIIGATFRFRAWS